MVALSVFAVSETSKSREGSETSKSKAKALEGILPSEDVAGVAERIGA